MFGHDNLSTLQVQLYHLGFEGGICNVNPPDPALAELINYYWLLDINAPSIDLEVIPDTAIDLVMSPNVENFAALYFPVDHKFTIPLSGPIRFAGISFNLNSLNGLLPGDMNVLKALSPGLETVTALEIESLVATIQGVRTIKELVPIFNQFWLKRETCSVIDFENRRSPNHLKLMQIIEDSLDEASIAALCNKMEISERQFRRLSSEMLGLSPKKLQRVVRLQSALAELLSTESKLLTDHYYDDSHQIRELKTLTGFTPGEIRRLAEIYNQSS